MEPLRIREYPEDILRKRCAPIGEITDKEEGLFEAMLFTMRHSAGIGLAAPQIGIARNLIVADIGQGPIRLADPVILKTNGLNKKEEGCLSIPDVSVTIDRPDEIIVSGLNEKGKVITVEARGFLARVLQHEIDHLKGKLIIDYVGLLEKMISFKPRVRRAKDNYANL